MEESIATYQSEMSFDINCNVTIQINKAMKNGGGIYAISSVTKLSSGFYSTSSLQFITNHAKTGVARWWNVSNSKLIKTTPIVNSSNNPVARYKRIP